MVIYRINKCRVLTGNAITRTLADVSAEWLTVSQATYYNLRHNLLCRESCFTWGLACAICDSGQGGVLT